VSSVLKLINLKALALKVVVGSRLNRFKKFKLKHFNFINDKVFFVDQLDFDSPQSGLE